MKDKLLLFILINFLLGNDLEAKNFERNVDFHKMSLELSTTIYSTDSIKKHNKVVRIAKSLAIIPAPLATAGSSCKEASDLTVKVFITASGGSGDIIEWFDSQSSSTIMHTGAIFAPNINKTTTYYVQSRSGSDKSIRVPVVASVYNAPPAVTLTALPSVFPVCAGTSITFTASDGAPGELLFEFSIDGIIKQQMSRDNTFTTSGLLNNQTVSVRTRFAVNFDGSITEAAWGTGAMEDNFLSSPLSVNAIGAYINSIKISPTEDKLIFGIAGKLIDNRSMLLFLDTKPGGFNVADYGDEAVSILSVKGFNFFNNNPSKFDSYFQADYCIAISTDGGGTNYFADVIELKSGISTKVYIGNASTGFPSAVMGVNNGNTGVNDYNLGFEVEVFKSLLGYITGDIKFFALTMQDNDINDVNNYSVTNSFLSPELNSNLDYGSIAVDYNFKDPNPVVVSSDALIPCYKEASFKVSITEQPTPAIVDSPKTACSLTSASLEGNSPSVGTGSWSKKSGPGTVVFSDSASGSSTATVSIEGSYIFTWTITNGNCTPSTADIEVRFYNPLISPISVGDQTVCAQMPIQTLTATANVQAGESVVWYDAPTGGNIVSDPSLNSLGAITYYAETKNETTFCKSSTRTAVKLELYALPTITGALSVCVGTTITLIGSATADSTTPWTSSSTAVATVNNLGVVTGISAGTSLITYKNSNGCTLSATVTVNALPTIIGVLSVCVGATTTLIGSATADTSTPWTSASTAVATVSDSGVVIGVSAGTSIITYKNNNGCSVTTTVIVNALPRITGALSVCVGATTTLIGSATADTSTPWSSASTAVATVSDSGVVTGLSAGTSLITYKNSNGCTITTTVTVNVLPIITGPLSVCAGATITLSGSATADTTTPWLSASTAIATVSSSGVVTGISAGMSVITYKNNNGCVTTATVTVDSPSITGTLGVCLGATTTLIGSATADSTTPWTSASTAVATISDFGVVTTVAIGTSLITYKNSNGCTTTATITVNALPIPTLSSNDIDNTFCSGTSVTFTAGGGTNYDFRVNDSSVQNGLSTTYTTTGLTNGQAVDVIVTNASGCIATSTAIINTVNPLPLSPMLEIIKQPTCIVATGSFIITNYDASYTYAVNPSIGVSISGDVITAPTGNYTVTATLGSCTIGSTQTINPIPVQIQFESTVDCVDKDYVLTATSLNNSFNPNNVTYLWKDNLGNLVGTNSNVLNVTDVINSISGEITYPLTFTLTINEASTECSTTENVVVESIYCNFQKGISPDGNGSNDFLDLKNRDVKNLEIFDRYGIKVYNQSKYTDQWKGQSNKGNELPSATYYFVIEFNNGKSKTGWIYLIREK